MRKIIYTILFGDYKLHEPEYFNPNWEHICFSDRNRKSKNWKVIPYSFKNMTPRKKSRFVKIKFDDFISSDINIYIDSKFKITCDLDKFVEENLKFDIAVMKHKERSCAYAEAEFCIKHKIEQKEILGKQMRQYEKEGFPKNFGLYAPGIMIRKNTSEVKQFMKLWWDEVNKYSSRDIPSLSYCLWKHPIELSLMKFKETYDLFR